ncbi:GH25 family lysozyme [Lentilactobacillus parabuchneri]|uniref:GH25 family lysozyme n=1 Tax=Lentilactobacillus parabuchneri TaxID=152331 RepID=UPI000A110802|nr:GH25 family lysozyme [Lentilactobacillus parabuchneri]ORN32807.1 Autolytic lysozyme [Lentilactobacillus parabuchneri]ORN33189.1 Autolytic lysozyme [Lentilactobacillus parabuchneri]ORN36964.1 Autolytic lysozyme [Lentilactobacillus parabuchneri]
MKRRDIQPIYAETYQRRKRTRRVVLGIFLLVVIFLVSFLFLKWHENEQLKKYPIRGVAIDQSNGYIDFESLKSQGINFVYLKATQGAAYTDDSFDSNFQRSQGSQLPIGVYHYFSFTSSPASQFNNFVRQVKYNTGSLPICIQVQYYGTFDANSIHWQNARKSLSHLSRLLKNYYKRPVVICASHEVIKNLKLKATSKTQFWVTDGKLGKPNADATFIQENAKTGFKLDRQLVFLPMSVFNGNRGQWHRYVD